MGIYDRSYMDGTEDSPYGSASERRFSATAVLVIINVVIWVLWQFGNTNPQLKRFMFENFTCSPHGVLIEHRYHTLLTSNFSHFDLMHIVFNMLFFWFLAQEVELRYGRRNLYWVYFLTALLTGLAYITVDMLKKQMFAIDNVPALGA